MTSHLKPIPAPGTEGEHLSQLEWSVPASGRVPQCLGRGTEVQRTSVAHANFIWSSWVPGGRDKGRGRGVPFPRCSSMIPECRRGQRRLLSGLGSPSWEVQARWVLSTQPRGWAGAPARHGAGWPAEAAAAVSGVRSGSVSGTRSWWGRPGSWGRHCMGAAGAAGFGQGPEWSGRRCPRGRVTEASCRPWSRCCWGCAPGAPPRSCRAS